MLPFEADHFFDKTFEHLEIENLNLASKVFENCVFKKCIFRHAKFHHCRFNDCTFEQCDLGLSNWKSSALVEVSFNGGIITGVNWTELHWPLVKLASPLYFNNCNLSYGSFYGLSLPDLLVERCKAHECDFREAVLTQASFSETDLKGSLFMHTQLSHANFADALNYHIDTRENTIKSATFSFPEVIALLHCQEISIVGYDHDEDN